MGNEMWMDIDRDKELVLGVTFEFGFVLGAYVHGVLRALSFQNGGSKIESLIIYTLSSAT